MKRQLLAAGALLAAGCASHTAADPQRTQAVADTRAPSATAAWSAWPQASHDGRRSGSAPYRGPQTGHLRWTRKLEGNVTPGPVVGVDGSIIAASNAGVLHALDPRTGRDRWSFDGAGGYGIDQSTSPAVLKNGTILWPGPHNTLYALSARGERLWQQTFSGQPSSPAVSTDGSTVVVGSSDGTVSSLDVRGASHTIRWSVALPGSSLGSVALSPHDAHRSYQSVDNRLVALDDGHVAWTRTLPTQSEVSPAVAPDGTVVIGDNDPNEYAFHPDGSRAWTYRHGGQTYSSPVVTEDGTAWFGDHRAFVTGLDVTSGHVRGRFRGQSVPSPGGPSVGVWTSPVIDSAHDVYWGTRLGHVYGRSPAGAQLLDIATDATVDSYPALTADGALIVGVTDGRLLAIGS